MQNTRYIIGALGIVLIIALGFLLQDLFPCVEVLVLDVAVVIAVYVASVYMFSSFLRSTGEFSGSVPGLGANMYTIIFYIILALGGVLLGFFAEIAFKWQLFGQICFIVMLVSGLLVGQTANQRQNKVVQKSESNFKSKEQLLTSAQLLKTAALSNVNDENLREAINKFAERINYLSPSQSEMARALETKLSSCISQLQTLVNQGADSDMISKELEMANQILKQRIQTY